MPGNSASALSRLLEDGIIDDRRHAAGLAWASFHRRFDAVARSSKPGRTAALPEAEWSTLKRERAMLVATAGFDRFMLDRLCLDDEAPLVCEIERVRMALERVAEALACYVKVVDATETLETLP